MIKDIWQKFDEDDKDDIKGEDFDVNFFICDVHEKKTKLVVTPKVILDKIYYEWCVSHMLKDNFRIDGIKVNILIL